MTCGKIECEIEEVVEQYAQKQAGRAFRGIESVRNSPDGVDELTASAWATFWNQCVDWILGGNKGDAEIYTATPVQDGATWSIRTGKGISKLRARSQK